MSNGEEVWQVAGRRRHRRPSASAADKQPRPELRRTEGRHGGPNRHSGGVHGRRKSKGKAHQGDYSYSTSTKGTWVVQAADGCREEEMMRKELAKLDKLKVLLRETALWERLVEGLGGTLTQLGLAAAFCDEGSAAGVSPAVAASTDSLYTRAGNPGTADSPVRELVCYGIGNFSESDSSRYQLALALCLRDLLSVASSAGDGDGAAATSTGARGPTILVFDPVMGETETVMLEALGCGTLQNEEGKRPCCRRRGERGNGGGDGGKAEDDGESFTTPTLFFMPHCPRRLYSNVLWANWSSRALGSIIVLGNKLSSYGDRLLGARARADPTNALLRAGPLLQDVDLLPYPASERARWRRDVDKLPGLERAFNDLALSFSGPEARGSAEGLKALRDRPLEFVEDEDGELVTGRARAVDVN